jgi:hypothetical protein
MGIEVLQPITTVEPQYPRTTVVVETILQGPAGPPGSGSAYVHTQATASAVWTVNHNLGYYPSVAVVSPGGLEIIAETEHVSVNQLRVKLATALTGQARCV